MMYYISDIRIDVEDNLLREKFCQKLRESTESDGHVSVGLLVQKCQYLRNCCYEPLYLTFDCYNHLLIVSD